MSDQAPDVSQMRRSALRDLRILDQFRKAIEDFPGDETCGFFVFPSPAGGELRALASAGEGWDHVSVSRRDRIPTWTEMEFARKLFFRDDATVMQLHVPPTEHINAHPFCLHLWRPQDVEIPRPPPELVA